jgi:protein-tyrosine-phosphatase
MAEAILKELVLDEVKQNNRLIPIEIISAGICADDGFPASRNAMEVCSSNGIDLKFHRTRRFNTDLAKSADLILTMSKMHTKFIKTISPSNKNVYELKKYARKGSVNSSEIIDPAGEGKDIYKQVFSDLNMEIRRVGQKIFSLAEEHKSAQG